LAGSFLGWHQPLSRPISMASFAVNYYASGMDAYYFKLTNLAIHVLNGMLVFIFARLLLNLYSRIHREDLGDNTGFWISVAVAAMWLLHPFNLTGVLYVVQRMNSLAALFTLFGLVLYLHGRQALLNDNRSGFFAIGAALFVCTPLAALCKENGILLPWFIFVTEAILLRWNVPNQGVRRILLAIVGLSVVVPLLLALFYVLKTPDFILGGYVWRDFSLTERLMTEARVLWFYLHMIMLPNMGEMGLHHDDFLISRGLLTPWITLLAMVGLLLLAIGAFALRNKQPLIAFGIIFFFVGHAMESTIIPLELVFEHRNYLPMLGILLPLAFYSLHPELHLASVRARRTAFMVLVILFAGLTASRAQQWGDAVTMRLLEVERHPLSVRANVDLANLYSHTPPTSQADANDLYQKALFHYQKAADNAPSSIAGLFGIFAMNVEKGLPEDEALLKALEDKLATVPFGPPNKNTLIGAIRDIASGYLVVDREVVDRLYRAVMSNPRLEGEMRRQVISEFDNMPAELRPKN